MSLLTNLFDLQALNRVNFQESNLWEFYLFKVPQFESNLATGAAAVASLLEGTALHYLVSDVSFTPLPTISMEFHKPTGKYFPKDVSPSNELSVTFRETETFAVYQNIKNLMQNQVNTKTYRLKSSGESRFLFAKVTSMSIMGIVVFYKKDTWLERLTSSARGINTAVENDPNFAWKKEKNAITRLGNAAEAVESIKAIQAGQVFIFNEMALTSAGSYSLSYGGGDAITIPATFTYNHVLSGSMFELTSGAIFRNNADIVAESSAWASLAGAFI